MVILMPEQPPDSMNRSTLRREIRLLGGTVGDREPRGELQNKLLRLRKIRDELDEEERREGRIEVIGWKPGRNGRPHIPVIQIITEDEDDGYPA